MIRPIVIFTVFACLLWPALADQYPVTGRFGVVTAESHGLIDCTGHRVVSFFGERRTDTGGGVPGYRNKSVTPVDGNTFSIVDEFTTGQIYYAKAVYTLTIVNPDRIDLTLSPRGHLRLQRCNP